MQHWLLFLGLSFLSFTGAERTWIANPTTSGETPSIEWLTEVEHDFGDIPLGKPVTFRFQFKNKHSEAITIDNIRTSCGCTAPDWSEAPIESMATDSIKITYDAKKAGYFYKKIKVFFSHQRKAEILYVEGFVMDSE